MKILVDTNERILIHGDGNQKRSIDLYCKEAMEIISSLWIKLEWNQKYSYTFTWLGRPIIQLPEDLIRVQEVIFTLKPDVILEIGVAHGGSLIYYASICRLIGNGRVIGVDIEIRPHNRIAIESHPMSNLISLIEGNSVNPEIIQQVESLIMPNETVMVFLDSCHDKVHVYKELEMYSKLVTPGSYIVATDGIIKDLFDVPHGKKDWEWNNPFSAVVEFAADHSEFEIRDPEWLFNESQIIEKVTHWPGAWLYRKHECE